MPRFPLRLLPPCLPAAFAIDHRIAVGRSLFGEELGPEQALQVLEGPFDDEVDEQAEHEREEDVGYVHVDEREVLPADTTQRV